MNIVYLHQYFTTPDFSGGVRSYEFAKRMVEEGHNVDMITSTAFFPISKKKSFSLVTKKKIDGINVHAIHVSYGNKMSFPKRILSFLTFMIISSLYILSLRKADLIYATSTPLTIGIPAVFGKYAHRIPLVFEVRDVWPDIPIAMGIIKNRFVIRLLYALERFIYKNSNRLVTLSVGMTNAVIAKGVSKDKVTTIPNASDIKDFNISSTHDLFKSIRETPHTKVCLYAGTFGIVNNLTYLVELARAIKSRNSNIKIALIGDGIEKDKITDAITKYCVDDVILVYPPVRKRELIKFIKSADACISTVKDIPELFNNSANKYFDALAAGKPLIINHEGWQADEINNNSLGIVLDQDIEKSASRLIQFMQSLDSHDNLEKHIRAFAKENYARDLLFRNLMKHAIQPCVEERS